MFINMSSCNITQEFWDKLTISIEKHCQTGQGGLKCTEWVGYCDREGYPVKRITWPDGKCTQARVQRLVMMVEKKCQLPYCDINGHCMDVSHLCHNRACVKSEHLTFEAHYVNTGRRQCIALGSCLGHTPSCIF